MHISVLVCWSLKAFLGMVNGHLGDNKQVLETKGGNGELRLYNFIHIKTGCKFKKGQNFFTSFFVPKNEPENCLDGSN